ncbi:hypothetical protein [Pseudomonas sediminis]
MPFFVLRKEQGEFLYYQDDNKHLGFLAGAGTLNHGYNNPL